MRIHLYGPLIKSHCVAHIVLIYLPPRLAQTFFNLIPSGSGMAGFYCYTSLLSLKVKSKIIKLCQTRYKILCALIKSTIRMHRKTSNMSEIKKKKQ